MSPSSLNKCPPGYFLRASLGSQRFPFAAKSAPAAVNAGGGSVAIGSPFLYEDLLPAKVVSRSQPREARKGATVTFVLIAWPKRKRGTDKG